MFDSVDTELKIRLDCLIKELEDRIEAAISSDALLAETAGVLRSIPGIRPVARTMLIAEMPELGTITAHDSGTPHGKPTIAAGRRALRHVMFQAALVTAHHNPSIKAFADRWQKPASHTRSS